MFSKTINFSKSSTFSKSNDCESTLIFSKSNSPKNLYQGLTPFFSKYSTVQMISFSNKPDDDFIEFSNILNENKSLKITSIGFNDVEFDEQDLNNLKNFLTKILTKKKNGIPLI